MNTLLKISLLLATIAMVGCQSKTDVGGSSSSSSTSYDQNAIMECIPFTGSDNSGKARTYYYFGALDTSRIIIRFATLNSILNGTTYINVFKTQVSSQNVVSTSNTALPLQIERVSDGFSSSSQQLLDKNFINNFMSRTVTSSDLNSFNIVVNGLSMQDQVLRIITYDSTTNAVVGESRVLIPAVLANPNAYIAKYPSSSNLTNLHPFINNRDSGWTDAQFVAQAQSYCF